MLPPRIGGAPKPGSDFAGFQVLATLGRGGLATVFRAHAPDGREVALKVLDPDHVGQNEVRRMVREYRALSRVDAPNVVSVYQTGVHEGMAWMSMRLLPGPDLDVLVQRWHDAPPNDRMTRAEQLLRGMLRGLSAVHDKGLVHRDLKPSNVMLDEAGEPVITDFGVVTNDRLDPATSITEAGRLIGTVAFMAPELITSDRVDARTDLYALGALLYVLLTGRRPIEANSVAGFLARHLTEAPRAPTEWNAEVPPLLDRICLRLLQKDPARRYASARAVISALDGEPDAASALRGREEWVSLWSSALTGLRAGRGALLVAHGPPGIGRTALLQMSLGMASEQGFDVRSATGMPHALASEWLQDTQTVADPSGVDAAARSLLRSAPIVLAVDDADRLEGVSLDLVSRIVRLGLVDDDVPVVVLATATSLHGTLTNLVNGATTGLPATAWPIPALDRTAIGAVLRDWGLVGPVTGILAKRLHQDWRGYPGSVRAMFEALKSAGWVAPQRAGFVARRPLDDFRNGTLPVPDGWVVQLGPRLERMNPNELAVIEAMAVVGRATSGALIARVVGDPEAVGSALDALVRRDDVHRDTIESQEVFSAVDPALLCVAMHNLTPERAAKLHHRIADALSGRRRADPAEVARHYEAGAAPGLAWKWWIAAARRTARGRTAAEAAVPLLRARALDATAREVLTPEDIAPHAVWLNLLHGEAELGRGQWKPAIDALQTALAMAKATGTDGAVGRCQAALGRAYVRAGDHSRAQPLLLEAVERAEGSERMAARRSLADVQLQSGDLQGSEALWRTVLLEASDTDAEARARRGLANVLVVLGQWEEATEQLTSAEELLADGGDPHVTAGVLGRLAELHLANGAAAMAKRRVEALRRLVDKHEINARSAEAWSLQAAVAAAFGESEGVRYAARQAASWCRVPGSPLWEVEIRVGRLLLDLGDWDELSRLGLIMETAPARPLDDPPGQMAGVRSRFELGRHPRRAADLARWAWMRDSPFALRRVASLIDIATTFGELGDRDMAAAAARLAIKRLPERSADGMRVEAMRLAARFDPTEPWAERAAPLAARILARRQGEATR